MAQTYQELSRVILQIFVTFRRLRGNFFPLDYVKLHNIFYVLKEKFPEHFGRLLFDSNGPFVTSDELDDVMFDLSVTGIVDWTDTCYYIVGKPKQQNLDGLPSEKVNEIVELFAEGVQ